MEVLGGLSQRIAISQVLEAAEWLASTREVARTTRVRRDEGIVPTNLEDESTYPTGGFASVSTVGSLENLLTSELIYMNEVDEKQRGDREDLDHFDLRYIEGELLYYTRDESLLVRPRRLITVVLAEDLIAARLKDPGVEWQRGVLVLSLLVTLARQVTTALGDQELRLDIYFEASETSPTTPQLDEEYRLLELLFREWVDRGVATLDVAPQASIVLKIGEAARGSASQVILVGMQDHRRRWIRSTEGMSLELAAVVVDENLPRLLIEDRDGPRKNKCVAPRAVAYLYHKAAGSRNSSAISGVFQRGERDAQATECSRYSCAGPKPREPRSAWQDCTWQMIKWLL